MAVSVGRTRDEIVCLGVFYLLVGNFREGSRLIRFMFCVNRRTSSRLSYRVGMVLFMTDSMCRKLCMVGDWETMVVVFTDKLRASVTVRSTMTSGNATAVCRLIREAIVCLASVDMLRLLRSSFLV